MAVGKRTKQKQTNKQNTYTSFRLASVSTTSAAISTWIRHSKISALTPGQAHEALPNLRAHRKRDEGGEELYSSRLTTASPPSVCLRIRKGLIMSLEQRILFVFASPIKNLTSESSLILIVSTCLGQEHISSHACFPCVVWS